MRMPFRVSSVSVDRLIVPSLIIAGVLFRLVWLFLDGDRLDAHRSEMWHVTAHWAATGELGDAYGGGSGISSHVGPVNVIVAGLVYRLFGIDSLTSEITLSAIAALTCGLMYYCLYRVGEYLHIDTIPRLICLILLLFVPFNFYLEVVDFRIREGSLATLCMTGLLWLLLRLDAQVRIPTKSWVFVGLAAAFAFLVTPVVALGIYAGIGLIMLRRPGISSWAKIFCLVTTGFIIVNGPWIVRNYSVYDRFMPTRGNFGLEIATANHAAAVDPSDPRAVFQARMAEVHPFFSAEARSSYDKWPSDVDYFMYLKNQTFEWIEENSRDFITISLRHLKEFWFPPVWVYKLYSNDPPEMSDRIRQAWAWVTAGLALGALTLGLVRQPRQWLFALMSILPMSMIYMLVQPTPRYRYLIASLTVLWASHMGWLILQRIWWRMSLYWNKDAASGEGGVDR